MIELDDEPIAMLLSLQKQSGKTILDDLLELFSNNTPDVLVKMSQALAENQGKDLMRMAHSLKSDCANLGLIQMRLLALEIERLCHSSEGKSALEIPQIRQLLARLNELYEPTLKELQTKIQSLKQL